MSKIIPVTNFLGLETGLSVPGLGSAELAENVVVHKTRGMIEVADGASAILSSLPANGGAISNLSLQRLTTFYVPDHGGKTISVLLGTYRRSPEGSALSVYYDAPCVWIRPYWSGAAWVDSWLELSEFHIFEIASKAANKFNLANTPAMSSSIIDANALNNFVVTKFTGSNDANFTNDDNMILVTGSSYNAGAPYLNTFDDVNAMAGWSVSDAIIVWRSPFWFNTPITSHSLSVRPHFDELRVSNGGTLNSNLVAAILSRVKTMSYSKRNSFDGIFMENACMNIPSKAVSLVNLSRASNASTPLAAGVWDFKFSLKMDDGNETELRSLDEAISASGAEAGKSAPVSYNVKRVAENADYWFFMSDSQVSKVSKSDLSTVGTWSFLYYPSGSVMGVYVFGDYLYALCSFNTSPNDDYFVYKVNIPTMTTAASYSKGAAAGIGLTQLDGNLLQGSLDRTNGKMLLAVNNSGTYKYALFDTSTMSELATLAAAGATTLRNQLAGGGGNGTYLIGWDNGNSKLIVVREGASTITAYTITGHTGTIVRTFIDGSYYYMVNSAGTVYRGSNADLASGSSGTVTSWLTIGETIVDAGYFGTSARYVFCTATNLRVYNSTPAALVTVAHTNLDMIVNTVYSKEVLSIMLTTGEFQYLSLGSTSGNTFNGYESLQYDVALNPAMVPPRIKYVRVWGKGPSDSDYVLAKEHDLTTLAFGASATYNSTLKHAYFVTSSKQTLVSTDLISLGGLAVNELGRVSSDSGIIQYEHAVTSGTRAFAVGVTVSGKRQRNKIFTTGANGSGQLTYDVFPNDADYILDVEFNDGDYIMTVGVVMDRVLALKAKSVVLLSPQLDGSFTRDIVAQGIGVAAVRSVVQFNEALYWLDHSGVYEFTTRGFVQVSGPINDQILAFTDAQREAAFATVDPKHQMYRLHINGTIFNYNIRDKEWTTETLTPTVVDMASDNIDDSAVRGLRRFVQLVNSSGTNLIFIPAPLSRQNGSTFTAKWRSTKLEVPEGAAYDMIVHGIGIEYSAPAVGSLVVNVYANDSLTPVNTFTLPSSSSFRTSIYRTKLGFRAKQIRFDIVATINADAQSFKVKRMHVYYSPLRRGGSKLT